MLWLKQVNRVKVCFDFGIFITVIIITGLLSKKTDDYFRKRMPVVFDIHKIHPYTTYTEANTFFTNEVVGVNLTDDAVTVTTLETAAKADVADCDEVANAGLDVCVKCATVFAARVKQYQADSVFADAGSPTAAEVLPYSKQMQACIHRAFKPHSVSYLFSSNIWTHFTWWCAVATVVSLLFSVEDDPTDDEGTTRRPQSTAASWVLGVAAAAIVVATLVMNILYSTWLTNGTFDLTVWGLQLGILVILGVAATVFYNTQKYDREMDLWGPLWDNILFDSLLLLAVPSIAVITGLLRGWATYDMLMFIITTGIVLVTACMADNSLVIMWASEAGKRNNEQHGSIHAGLFLLIIFSFLLYATINLPRTLVNDYYHSSLLSGLFLFFLFLVVVLPPILLEILEFKNAKTIVLYKMYTEFITRAIFFTVFVMMYVLPEAGKTTPAP